MSINNKTKETTYTVTCPHVILVIVEKENKKELYIVGNVEFI